MISHKPIDTKASICLAIASLVIWGSPCETFAFPSANDAMKKAKKSANKAKKSANKTLKDLQKADRKNDLKDAQRFQGNLKAGRDGKISKQESQALNRMKHNLDNMHKESAVGRRLQKKSNKNLQDLTQRQKDNLNRKRTNRAQLERFEKRGVRNTRKVVDGMNKRAGRDGKITKQESQSINRIKKDLNKSVNKARKKLPKPANLKVAPGQKKIINSM